MIIAEIGQHWQDIDTAKKMILQARDAGAGLVKFQLYSSEKLYGEPGHNELSFEQAKELFDFGKQNNIEVFFSVFDVERVKWCEKIGVQFYKIAARWNQDDKLLWAVRNTRKPCYISVQTGDDVPDWPNWIKLFCVSEYPAKHVRFPHTKYMGYSDHAVGLDYAKVALTQGMTHIEKHFCLNHQTGCDAAWSMDKDELKELVDWERNVQLSLS